MLKVDEAKLVRKVKENNQMESEMCVGNLRMKICGFKVCFVIM